MKKKYKAKVMMEVLGSVLVRVVLLTTILVYTPALAQLSSYNSQGLRATTLEEVLVLPDEEIDLAAAIMILYKEWDASFDVAESLEEIDRMALELEVRISPEDSPEKIVSLINQYLFEENTYSSLDPADPDYMKKLEYSALPCVIESNRGNCLGLSLLYLALAERLSLPIYGVVAPEHIFVRYDDGKRRINIDPTDKGEEYEDSRYEKMFMLHSTYRNYNFYLRNLSKREVIGAFLNNLGVAYGGKGMYDEEIALYKKALEIVPNYAEAHTNLGAAYNEKGMYDEVMAEHKRALEINPNYAKAHYNLGVAYYEKGMYDKAIAEFKRAIKINPNHAIAHYNLGVVYHRKGMYDEEIAEYKKVIEIDPNEAKAHYNLGAAYYEKRMYDEAIAEHKRALDINPNYAKAHYGLGLAYGEKGMYDEEIAEYKKAIEIDPNEARVHYNLGVAYYEKGMYDEEIAEYKKAIEVDPNYFEAHYNLGIAYHGKGMYYEAVAEFKKAIKINPNYAGAHHSLGVAYGSREMYDEAATEFRKALEINPDHAEAHYNLAATYYSRGEHVLAIQHCDRATELGIRVHPEFLEALKPYREK